MVELKKEGKVDLIETGNLIVMDPDELIRNNPAALIVNQESYALISAFFSPKRYDPPQLVRVRAYIGVDSPLKFLLVDGMTRTIVVSRNRESVAEHYPDFQFVCREVTNELIQNPMVVLPDERQEGQTDLTMQQYLRAVVPPTVEHVHIAPERIAAHLINSWDIMVGEKVAERLSALASLDILADQRVPVANEQLLIHYLDAQGLLIPRSTQDENERIKYGLLVMAAVIRQARLDPARVAREAFTLVGRSSSAIKGEVQARREIFGLLHGKNVERALESTFSQVGEREVKRAQLGENLMSFARRSSENSQVLQLQPIINEILADPQLTFQNMVGILTSDDPLITHRVIKQEANRSRLQSAYQAKTERRVTEVEKKLIDSLGRKTHLTDNELLGIVGGLYATNDALTSFEKIKNSLPSDVSILLQEIADKLFDANTSIGLRRQLNEFQAALTATQTEYLAQNEEAGALQPPTPTSGPSVTSVDILFAEREPEELKELRLSKIIDQGYQGLLRDEDYWRRKVEIMKYLRAIHFDDHDDTGIAMEVKRISRMDEDLQQEILGLRMLPSEGMITQEARNAKVVEEKNRTFRRVVETWNRSIKSINLAPEEISEDLRTDLRGLVAQLQRLISR